jgi:hypothetical protein
MWALGEKAVLHSLETVGEQKPRLSGVDELSSVTRFPFGLI